MTKDELKAALRSATIGEAIDRLPEGGNFAATCAIHEYPAGRKATLVLDFFPQSVTVEAPPPPPIYAPPTPADPDAEVR